MASALELIEIDEVARLLAAGAEGLFTEAERAYAGSKPDPARRLAARLAAKRAAARLLGVSVREVEVLRDHGRPPRLRLSALAQERLRELGAVRALVSLTHERRHAAAAVVLLGEEG
ncbi:MAG TPA: holo-ACP synthase [Vicinamibacteria bacterium]|nr:holo-ACP synthase [Vicinamibacteria bacterium]